MKVEAVVVPQKGGGRGGWGSGGEVGVRVKELEKKKQ